MSQSKPRKAIAKHEHQANEDERDSENDEYPAKLRSHDSLLSFIQPGRMSGYQQNSLALKKYLNSISAFSGESEP